MTRATCPDQPSSAPTEASTAATLAAGSWKSALRLYRWTGTSLFRTRSKCPRRCSSFPDPTVAVERQAVAALLILDLEGGHDRLEFGQPEAEEAELGRERHRDHMDPITALVGIEEEGPELHQFSVRKQWFTMKAPP